MPLRLRHQINVRGKIRLSTAVKFPQECKGAMILDCSRLGRE